jgi:hypothetical protein
MKALAFALLASLLSGCGIGGFWMNGNPYMNDTSAPYGAHFYKEGMTRESRLDDLVACGAYGRNISVYFTEEEKQKEKRPMDTSDLAVHLRLAEKLKICMQVKGYIYITDGRPGNYGCDARCMYP